MKLEVISTKERVRAREQGAPAEVMAELFAKLDQMSIDELQILLINNNYRLAHLNFSQQNDYYQVIGERIAGLKKRLTETKCAPVVAKVPLPGKRHDAIIADGLDGVSVRTFLCGAILGPGEVGAKATSVNLDVTIRNVTLTFDIHHFQTRCPKQSGVGLVSSRRRGDRPRTYLGKASRPPN